MDAVWLQQQKQESNNSRRRRSVAEAIPQQKDDRVSEGQRKSAVLVIYKSPRVIKEAQKRVNDH